MSIALVSDPHLIAPDDEHDRRNERERFASAWPSFRSMLRRLNEEADRVVVLGDLVDYYSAANRAFALDLLADLEVPWHLTPGNHDLQVRPPPGEEEATDRDVDWAREGWAEADVTLANRVLDAGDLRLLLVESALSEVPEGTGAWLDDHLSTDRHCVVCTHVPLDTPEVVEAITDVDPDRDLEKYVQRGSPELFDRHLRGRVDAVFSGHLHFPAEADVDGTRQHILPPCIHVAPPYPEQGTAVLLEPDDPGAIRRIRTEELPE